MNLSYFYILIVIFTFRNVSTAIKQKDKTEIQKAIDWLMSQRQLNYGWGNGLDTAQALLAVELTKSSSNLERKLSAKQLEIELILNLWHHDDPDAIFIDSERLTIGNIAIYCLALIAACHDPRFFHGHDLIGSLLHHEANSDLEFTISSLASCKAGMHVRKRYLRRLIEITNTKSDVEVLSKAILALQCVERDHRNRNVKPLLKKPLTALTLLQEADGGFGSLHATAIATQALQEGKAIWNRTGAVSWLLNHQNPDGSFWDVPTTAEVIIALANTGINSFKDDNCEGQSKKSMEETETAIITPYMADITYNTSISNTSDTFIKEFTTEEVQIGRTNITVTYSLWVGSNISEKYSINITVVNNETLYDIMQRAAETDPKYAFSATEWPNGHYVHTLYGYKEEPSSYHYWVLYRLQEFPDPKNPPGNQMVASRGVDDLIIKDGEHYLFWYKKL
ncbi:hypothetical protein PGB90_004254 [Kerria lacca]